MILDRLSNADRYVTLHPLFEQAFRALRVADLRSAPDGKQAVDGDNLFLMIARSAGKGRAGAKLEAHRRYIDIQYCLEGTDRIGWKPTDGCKEETPYDADSDLAFYRDVPESWFEVPAGFFAIFFPDDAHAPLAGDGPVHKVIVKVTVDA